MVFKNKTRILKLNQELTLTYDLYKHKKRSKILCVLLKNMLNGYSKTFINRYMWMNIAAKLVPGIIKTGMSIAANRRKTKELESVAELKVS